MLIIRRSVFVFLPLLVCAAAMAGNSLDHHQLDVSIDPATHSLQAKDVLTITGDGSELLLYLGISFKFTAMSQGDRTLNWERLEEGGKGTPARYRVKDWNPAGPPLAVAWDGSVPEFSGYGVSIIRPDLVELSGFCGWFPTIEPSSQAESFTYAMRLEMPDGWTVLSPRDGPFRPDNGGSMEFIKKASPIEDIFICASPGFRQYRIGGAGSSLLLYSLPRDDLEPIRTDFESVVSLCTEWFGEPESSEDIVAIISPRSGGAEWGYERGPFWVNADNFANYLLQHDWEIKGRKKSFAAHETIHTWFGKSLGFEDAWLKEALTQYLEVVVTAQIFEEPDLPGSYFEWYRERLDANEEISKTSVSSLGIDDSHYDHWYLKGSWAFWDLEDQTGREALIMALSDLHRDRAGSTISRQEFTDALQNSLGFELEPLFRHWFDSPGFKPMHRNEGA